MKHKRRYLLAFFLHICVSYTNIMQQLRKYRYEKNNFENHCREWSHMDHIPYVAYFSFYGIGFQSVFCYTSRNQIIWIWNDMRLCRWQPFLIPKDICYMFRSNAHTKRKKIRPLMLSFFSSLVLLFPLLHSLTCINSCDSQQWGLWLYQHFGLLRFIFALIYQAFIPQHLQ